MALTKAHNRMIEGAAINVKDYDAVGDGTTDDTTAIQDALKAAADIVAADNRYVAVFFPTGTYKTTAALQISKRIKIYSDYYRSAIIQADHPAPALYNADYDSGTRTYTEHLGDAHNGNRQNGISIVGLHFDHIGTGGNAITGNSPDSSTPYRSVIQLNNVAKLLIEDVRVDSKTNEKGMLTLRGCYVTTIRRFTTARGTNYYGGNAIWIMAQCNNILLERCSIYGGFETGYRFDAGSYDGVSDGMNSVTLNECDAEYCTYKEWDTLTNYGTGYGIWIGGDDGKMKIRGVRVIGGFWENCNVDMLIGSQTSGATVYGFVAESTFHGDFADSVNAFKILNSVGHRIMNPILARWDHKYLTLTGVSGTPEEGEIVNMVDRWGNAVTAIVISWASPVLTVRDLQGDIDPASSVTTTNMTVATLSSFSQACYYGVSGNPHFSISSGTIRALAGSFELPWYDSQNFKPTDYGLDDGKNTIKINGSRGNTLTYRSNPLWDHAYDGQIDRYRNSDPISKATVEAGVDIYKVIVPVENYPQTISLDLTFTHGVSLTVSPFTNNDSSTVQLSVYISRALSNVDSSVEFIVNNEVGLASGASAVLTDIVAGNFSASGNTGAGEQEITITYTGAGVSVSTDNYLQCFGTIQRNGGICVYKDSGVTG